jgi:hypothetical protein
MQSYPVASPLSFSSPAQVTVAASQITITAAQVAVPASRTRAQP